MRQEFLRKLIHIVFNTIIPLGYLWLNIPKMWMLILLGIASVAVIIIDLSRHSDGWIADIFSKYFNAMLRPHEINGKLTGASYVIVGSFISVAIFPKEIAILALLFTAVGDTFAALYGRRFGKIKIWNKTLEGSVVGFLSCIIVALFFPQIPNILKFGGAFAAMFIEVLPINIDDNLRIPLFSGLIMLIISMFII